MNGVHSWRRRFVMCVVALFVALITAPVVVAQPAPTAILNGLRADASRPIDFHARIYPDTLFVGQQATYQVAVLLSEMARARLRRNPEFLPPELRGLLAYELGTPRRVEPRAYGSATFEAHVFQRALFPVAAGIATVPAPQLSYTLPQSSSYFSREERYVARAESALVVVKSLPLEGRPDDFLGAVGIYRASVRIDSATARVGDPLVLTMRIEGTGNVKLLPRPLLEISWASTVTGSERVQVDSTGALVLGAKEFDWILTPTVNGRLELPALRYSYFDPYRAEYAYAEISPGGVTVAEGSLATGDEGESPVVLPLRAWERSKSAALLERSDRWSWGVTALWLVAPLPWVFLLLRNRRARTSRADEPVAQAPVFVSDHDAGPPATARRVRRVLLVSLAQRLAVPPHALTARDDVARTLRRRGVTRETTTACLAVLDRLAAVGFAAQTSSSDGGSAGGGYEAVFRAEAESLLARIDGEAVQGGDAIPQRTGGRIASGLGLLLACALTSLPVNQAMSQQPVLVNRAAPTRAAGMDLITGAEVRAADSLFNARQYSRATLAYAALVERAPQDAVLLTNWGAAAWSASDTVSAVVAWQRALRREPLAADLQERLALLPAGARLGIAAVPMVPWQPLLIGGTCLWLIGWLALAWRTRRARVLASRALSGWQWTAYAMLTLGVLMAASGWWGRAALSAEALAVAGRPETMRAAPGDDANALGGISTGDVLRVVRTQEGWARVTHADGRSGWLPAARLVSLAAPLVSAAPTQ